MENQTPHSGASSNPLDICTKRMVIFLVSSYDDSRVLIVRENNGWYLPFEVLTDSQLHSFETLAVDTKLTSPEETLREICSRTFGASTLGKTDLLDTFKAELPHVGSVEVMPYYIRLSSKNDLRPRKLDLENYEYSSDPLKKLSLPVHKSLIKHLYTIGYLSLQPRIFSK